MEHKDVNLGFAKTIAVDLDGTLAQYDGWKGIDHIGDPLPGAKEFLQALKDKGFSIEIYTTRCNSHVNNQTAQHLGQRIYEWLNKHGMSDWPHVGVYVKQGKPLAHAYVDDKAVSCKPQENEHAYQEALEQIEQMT